ncbi:MAG: glycine-rich protein [Anaerobutyricum soehngenii]
MAGRWSFGISLISPVFSHSSCFINNIRDTNSLLSRIIVAGGGGSAGYDVSNNAANGAAGGGTIGQDGLSNRVYHGIWRNRLLLSSRRNQLRLQLTIGNAVTAGTFGMWWQSVPVILQKCGSGGGYGWYGRWRAGYTL